MNLNFNYRKRHKIAFALIELLVAMSIFAVVVTVVYSTLYTSIKAYDRTQEEIKLNQEINQVLDKLTIELRNCYDAEYNETADKWGFIADPQSLSFFTIKDSYLGGESRKLLARVAYNFKDGKLFKKIQLDKDAFLDEANYKEEELISDIKEFNLQYLYFKKIYFEEEYKYEWKSEWTEKSLIPKGLKIEITRYAPERDMGVTLKRYILLRQGEIPAQE